MFALHPILSHWLLHLERDPLFQVVSMGREKFVTRFQLVFRILKGIVFLVLIGLLVLLFVGFDLAIADVGASILAFIPTGWFILLVSDSSYQLYLHVTLLMYCMCIHLFSGTVVHANITFCCSF